MRRYGPASRRKPQPRPVRQSRVIRFAGFLDSGIKILAKAMARVTQRGSWLPSIVLASITILCLTPQGHTTVRQKASQSSGAGRQQAAARTFHLLVIVHDENNIPVPLAHISIYTPESSSPITGDTDATGRHDFSAISASPVRAVAEKDGFYALTVPTINLDQQQQIEVALNHQQEYKEAVEVKGSTEGVDTSQIAAKEQLDTTQILELPYVSTRDIRNALPLLPGVVTIGDGQVHVNGAASNETLYVLDDFDISSPVSGLLDLRVSTDAVRQIDLEPSRTPVEYGRGTGGVLALQTSMGDDHFRFYATDFVPSFQQYHGFRFQNTTPRFALSGPLKKGKAWFYEAVEGEFDQNVYSNLPPGADTDHFWRFSNLLRIQGNLTPGNRLIGSFVTNRSRDDYFGLSLIQPLSTTATETQSGWAANLKDQISSRNGMLFETGFGFVQFNRNDLPLGDLPYVQLPGNALGNFYRTLHSRARRFEALSHLYLPPAQWHGHHEVSFGLDVEDTDDYQFVLRNPYTIQACASPLTAPGCTAANSSLLIRSVSFQGNPSYSLADTDLAGFMEDRWSFGRVLVEPGLRVEGDTLLGKVFASPRIASTVALTSDGQTKLSGGIGLYYDRTDLNLLSYPLAGQREDVFYAADGATPISPPVVTQFLANLSQLAEPRSINWSVGLERKLPRAFYVKAEFMEKRGQDGLDYVNADAGTTAAGTPASGIFVLQNGRQNNYDGLTVSIRHTFSETYPIMIAYTRSSATTNTDVESTLDNPLYGPQLPGPLRWDMPNRVLATGWLPLIHKFTLGYVVDWHTGLPFSLVNEDQELVGLPNRNRFPNFLNVDLHIERQFHFLGALWALRGGFNDINGSTNPSVVDNNIDSPTYLTFSGTQHRAFTGRIRFLGRK